MKRKHYDKFFDNHMIYSGISIFWNRNKWVMLSLNLQLSEYKQTKHKPSMVV